MSNVKFPPYDPSADEAGPEQVPAQAVPAPSGNIVLSKQDLLDLIQTAITASQGATANAAPAGNIKELAEAIGVAVANGIAQQTRRKVTFGEYEAKRLIGRSKLLRPFYENGVMINERQLSNTEIDLLNQITHSGRYVNRLVEVLVREDGADEVVELRFNNRTNDQRNDLARNSRDFEDRLRQICAAQKQERGDKVDRDTRAEARRHFGNGAATRQARETAGVQS